MKVANKPYLSSPGPGGGGEDVKELGRCHQASSGFRRDRGLGQGQGWGLGAGRIEGGEKVEGVPKEEAACCVQVLNTQSC